MKNLTFFLILFNAVAFGQSLSLSPDSLKVKNATNSHNAGSFLNLNTSNPAEAIKGVTYGTGKAAFFEISNLANTSNAVDIETNGSGHALRGFNRGNGPGGNFTIIQPTNNNAALYGFTYGTGSAVAAYINNTGSNAPASWNGTIGTGTAVYGVNTGVGIAGYFHIDRNTALSPQNLQPALLVISNGYGINTMLVNYTGPASMVNLALWQKSGVNKIRFSDTGNGYFAGTVNPGGADLAEAFETERSVDNYEVGDILVISLKEDRKVEKSSKSYSNIVAGVYATKPGVLLRDGNGLLNNEKEIPLGVMGVIPTKVCAEGGAIRRGDLLVSSSIPGYAMRGKTRKIKAGQIIGKALENFDSERGLINVLVGIN